MRRWPPHHPSLRRRAMAVVALAATALLAAAVLIFLVRNGLYLLVGLAGLVLAIAGGWWIIIEHMPRRAVGVAGLAGGAGALVAAMLAAGANGQQILLKSLVLVALYALVMATARAALAGVPDVGEIEPPPRQRRRPAHPVLLCNPRSGGGKVQQFGLVELATSLGVETVVLGAGDDLEKLARAALDRGADCLGMAGGDGSQALVASIAVEHDVPFVCVAAGTRNHFALDLGLDRDDPRASLNAFRDAVERHVDYATVNGRFFVNNVSLGVYATIVQQDGYREAKRETSKRLLPEFVGRASEPFDLEFVTPDGTDVKGAFLIMVSNNPYSLKASLDASQRRRLDSGLLGVFAVTARTGTQAAGVVTRALAGRGRKSRFASEFTAESFEVRSHSATAYAGIDGEALELDTPLEFRIHARGLRMLVPEGNLEVARRREARDVHLRDLPALAFGTADRTRR